MKLKTIIVDSCEESLGNLENKINTYGKYEIVEKYTNPVQLIEDYKGKYNSIDIIFTGVEMEGLNGLELTKKVKEHSPGINIVFVTHYEEYALESYKLDVLDYIKKPLKHEDLDNVTLKLEERGIKPLRNDKMVCLFNYFHFKENGKEIKNIKWRTAKTKELFIYLAHNRKEVVRKDVIIDLLWPDSDLDNAYSQLYSSIYHLRKVFRQLDFNIEIISTDNGYEIDFNGIPVDVDIWEEKINEMSELNLDDREFYKEVLDIYQGDYLGEETYLWKENERERLRVLYFYHTERLIDFLTKSNKNFEAILIALRVQKHYPFLEDSYFWLMQLYNALGNTYSVEDQYNKLSEMLKEELGIEPRREIREWYIKWLSQN